MSDPERIEWANPDDATKQAQLLAKIENERLIPDWCWGPLRETLAQLQALPASMSGVATAYLGAVVAHGPGMFTPDHGQPDMLTGAVSPSVRCGCGRDAAPDPPKRTAGGDEVTVATCECGQSTVLKNGEPYAGETRIITG